MHGQFHQFMVKERNPRFETPGHGHVIDAFYRIIHDQGEAGSTRLKALQAAVDWGQLAPKDSQSNMPIGNTPTIIFNFPAGVTPPSTVEIVQQPEALPAQ